MSGSPVINPVATARPPLPAALRAELVEALARLLLVDLERRQGTERLAAAAICPRAEFEAGA